MRYPRVTLEGEDRNKKTLRLPELDFTYKIDASMIFTWGKR